MAAGKLTSHEFYQEVGNADAAAYDFYVSSGNEIVVLDDEVIKKARELSYEWADNVAAKQGGWFEKVLKIQRDYQMAWSNAYKYRDSLSPQ